MSKRLINWIFLLAAAAPAAVPLILVFKFGVNVPYQDEWYPDIAGIYVKAHRHELTFHDLAVQHNEHRILVPRVVYLALNSLTHWNAIWEMLAEWIIVCATSIGLLFLIRRTVAGGGQVIFLWFLCNLLIFTPAQWENLLWGMGLANVMPMAFITAGIVVATSKLRIWPKTIAAIVLAILATYSSGNGILSWPLVGIVLFWPFTRKHLKPLLAWCGAFVLSIAFYFIGFTTTDQLHIHPYTSGIGQKFSFLLVFLGNSLAPTTNYAPITMSVAVTIVLLGLLLTAGGYFLHAWLRRGDYELGGRMLVWFSVAGFALLSGALGARARAGLGAEYALTSRYVTFSLYLPLALVPLLAIIAADLRRRSNSPLAAFMSNQFAGALAAVLILLVIFSFPLSLHYANLSALERRKGKAALLLANFLPDTPSFARLVLLDSPQSITDQVKALDAMGYINPLLIKSNIAASIQEANPDAIAGARGRMESATVDQPGQIKASGWAIFAKKHSPADGVFLTYEDERKQPIIFAFADFSVQRPAIAQELGEPGCLYCGWMARFPAARLPNYLRVTNIAAWAPDTDSGKAFKLEGTVNVNP